jgi:hypothetical protein
MCGVTT